MLRSRLVAWRSVAANPSMSPTVIGKNVTRAITTTFGNRPNPNQMISSGAIAMIGSVWEATRSGVSARRSHGDDLQRRHRVGPDLGAKLPALRQHARRRRQHLRPHPGRGDVPLPGHEPD